MNRFQVSNIRRQVLRGLKLLGATACAVTRQRLDANGMPTGETAEVGRIYGVNWRHIQRSAPLTMEIPGLVVGERDSAAHRYMGLLISGGAPETGDEIALPEGSRRIVSASERMGVWDLVLGGSNERTV